MQIDRESLVQRYEDLADTELLRRLRSGGLTELAHEVAMAELEARGLNLEPEPAVPAPPLSDTDVPSDEAYAAEAAAAPAEAALAADRFEHNPYQAPRAAQIQRDAARRNHSPWQLAWWGYIAVLALLCLSGFALNPRRLAEPSQWLGTLPLAGAIAGLVAWRLRRPLLHPLLWVALLAVFLAQFAFALHFYFELLSRNPESLSLGVMPVLLFGALVQLPAIWGLLRYAFFSSAIWQPRPAA